MLNYNPKKRPSIQNIKFHVDMEYLYNEVFATMEEEHDQPKNNNECCKTKKSRKLKKN